MPSYRVLAGSSWCSPVPEQVNVAVTLYSCDLVTIWRQDIRIFPQSFQNIRLPNAVCKPAAASSAVPNISAFAVLLYGLFGAGKPVGQCFLIRGPRFEYILLAEREVSFLFQAVHNLYVILIAVAVHIQSSSYRSLHCRHVSCL
jgi:hypothetical protein